MAVTYTKAERAAISLAWSHLTSHAMPMTTRYQINEAAKMERRSFNERIGPTQARAMIIGWFVQGFKNPSQPISAIAGCRTACLLAITSGAGMACFLNGKPDMTVLADAVAAHEAAFTRSV